VSGKSFLIIANEASQSLLALWCCNGIPSIEHTLAKLNESNPMNLFVIFARLRVEYGLTLLITW